MFGWPEILKNETRKLEVDYLLQQKNQPVPIDVKSKRKKARSLLEMLKKEGITYGYKFCDGNIGFDEDGIITLPFYMASFM